MPLTRTQPPLSQLFNVMLMVFSLATLVKFTGANSLFVALVGLGLAGVVVEVALVGLGLIVVVEVALVGLGLVAVVEVTLVGFGFVEVVEVALVGFGLVAVAVWLPPTFVAFLLVAVDAVVLVVVALSFVTAVAVAFGNGLAIVVALLVVSFPRR